MNITETIKAKKAMLEAIEYIMNLISREHQNHTENLEMHKDDLREFEANYCGDDIENDWTYKYKRQDIETDTAMIKAYEAIQKALEKLI